MSLITRPNTDTPAEFVPAGDDFLKDYIAEIEQPKQQQVAPEIPDDSDFEAEEPEVIKGPSPYAKQRGKTTANFAVSTLDKMISSMVAVYAASDDVSDFEADQEDLDELAEQLAVYFAENNLDIPPWIFALITFGMIMQKKLKGVSTMRKINVEKKRYQVENESLRNQIDILKQKNELQKLQQELTEAEAK